MRVKLGCSKVGCLWHGIGRDREWRKADGSKAKPPYFNCGLFAVDWYSSLRQLVIWFWRFDLTFTRK